MNESAQPEKQPFIEALRKLIDSCQDQAAPEGLIETLTIWAASQQTSLDDLLATKPDLHRQTVFNLDQTVGTDIQKPLVLTGNPEAPPTVVAPTTIGSGTGTCDPGELTGGSGNPLPKTLRGGNEQTIDTRAAQRFSVNKDSHGHSEPPDSQPATGIAGDHSVSRQQPTRGDSASVHSRFFDCDAETVPTNPIHSGLTHVPIKKHAEGGLGVVYVAADAQLQRAVALKEIKGDQVQNEEACDRFLFEAQVTARLEHPGIVPVYALGQHADGRPFYTMRFVEGETFSAAIKRLHQRRKQLGKLEWLDELRDLMRRFVDACHAIRYAHSHGFIHRDIKPLNIMLGSFGETLVVDWGLAKQQLPADAVDSELETRAFEFKQRMPQLQSANHSVEGRAAGTPGFMSPEQLEGRIDELDERSDVFSLGCTLYQLITGDLPFAGKTLQEVSTKVLNSDFRPPRAANPVVPRALESIGVKAIAHQPRQRYQSVQELIVDIESWLSDRPVSTYQEPLVERLQRWFRRHKTTATFLAAGLLFAFTVAAFALAIVNAEKKEKIQALNSERIAKSQTRDALNTLTDNLLGELLARQAELNDADHQFFEQVIDQYDRFTELDGESTEAIAFRGEGHLRVAILKRRLGAHDAAEHSFQQAIQLGEQWLQLDSQSVDPRYFQAQALGGYGQLHSELGRTVPALQHYSSAGKLLQSLVESEPRNTGFRIELASALNNAGNMLWRQGEIDAAIQNNQAAVATLASSSDADVRAKIHLVQILNNYGGLLLKDNARIDEAVETLNQAIQRWEAVQDQTSTDPRGELSGFRITPQQRMNGATVRTTLASALLKKRDVNGAVTQLEQAVEELSRLASQYPAFASFQQQLARSQMQLAKCLDAVKNAEADVHLQAAETVLESLVQRFPDSLAFRHDLAGLLETAAARTNDEESDLAIEQLRRSSRIRRQLIESDAQNAIYFVSWLATELKFANRLRKLDEHQSAIAAYRDLLESIDANDRNDTDSRIGQVQRLARFGLAESLGKAGKYSEAETVWESLAANRDDAKWRSFELQRIICTIRSGQTERAIQAIKTLEQVVADDDSEEFAPVDFYDIACCYSLAGEQDKDRVADLSDQSIQYLSKANAAGFFSESMKQHFATDRDLRNVSKTPAFQTFLDSAGLQYNVGMDF